MAIHKSRTYHDPIHGGIELRGHNPLEWTLIRLIDTPEFQRLRRIRQLDVASLTFHGAEGSRFTHSLGVLAVARRIFDRLVILHPFLEEYRPLVLTAALLHDLGHGPLSHASEELFGYHHEDWTCHILQESTEVGQVLRDFDPDLPAQLIDLFRGRPPLPVIGQLISGQLDCDRLDYLLRDSYFTGAQYGHLDLDRIIFALDYDPTTKSLVVRGRKGLVAVEHYLVVRHFMYTQVYNHPKNLVARFVLGRIFQRARELLSQDRLDVDDVLRAWLAIPPDQWLLSQYLATDDVVLLYHVQRWQNSDDPLLAELSRQMTDRDLPKAREITVLNSQQRKKLLERLEVFMSELRMLPSSYFMGIKEAKSKGYNLYDRGIYLKLEDGQIQEIADGSPLVRSLVLNEVKAWLIYPAGLEDQVARLIQIGRAVAGLG